MARPTLDTINLTVSTGTAAARTFSHTVPSGTDILVVVLQGWVMGETDTEGATPSGITWNGAPLTRIALTGGGWGDSQHGIWYLVSPAATTANIVVSGGDSDIQDGGVVKALNFSNVDTTVGTSGIRDLAAGHKERLCRRVARWHAGVHAGGSDVGLDQRRDDGGDGAHRYDQSGNVGSGLWAHARRGCNGLGEEHDFHYRPRHAVGYPLPLYADLHDRRRASHAQGFLALRRGPHPVRHIGG